MEILKYCKAQFCLILILFFVGYLFIKDGNRLNKTTKSVHCNRYFDLLFIFGELALMLDGFTSYTVNHLEQTPEFVNMIAHLAYLLTYQIFIFIHFMYWITTTDSMPKSLTKKLIYFAPIVVSTLVTVIFIPKIYYYTGEYTNYSKGISAYACYAAIGLYSILTMIVFVSRKNYIVKNKRTAFIASFTAVCTISLIQMFYNETLVAGIAVVLVVLSIYLCLENPSVKFLEVYHDEMVMGFATLVENKDGSTGEHIRRSSAYAVMIADELRKNPKYKKRITKDYLINLKNAAPMHDIGKIGVPDDILQKPGKLTTEEFDKMKNHTVIGGRIIRETFGHLDDKQYEDMTYKLTMYHHEKWNGKGYPENLMGTDIPLCARIMAVADVFDAVSAKRCYRDALPLDVCYQIISDGNNEDFDPDVVEAFFLGKKRVEMIYYSRH